MVVVGVGLGSSGCPGVPWHGWLEGGLRLALGALGLHQGP